MRGRYREGFKTMGWGLKEQIEENLPEKRSLE